MRCVPMSLPLLLAGGALSAAELRPRLLHASLPPFGPAQATVVISAGQTPLLLTGLSGATAALPGPIAAGAEARLLLLLDGPPGPRSVRLHSSDGDLALLVRLEATTASATAAVAAARSAGAARLELVMSGPGNAWDGRCPCHGGRMSVGDLALLPRRVARAAGLPVVARLTAVEASLLATLTEGGWRAPAEPSSPSDANPRLTLSAYDAGERLLGSAPLPLDDSLRPPAAAMDPGRLEGR
jgi:hypothetical protein